MKRYILLLLSIITLLAGCSQVNGPTEDITKNSFGSNVYFSPDALITNIISIRGDIRYTMATSQLIDTFFIACGLYYGFDSPYLFSQEMQINYQETMDYFAPYQDHPFIEALEPFLDTQNQYVPMDVLFYLPQYALVKKDFNEDIAYIQSDSFETPESFYSFLEQLYGFYLDTRAEEYFRTSAIHHELNQYTKGAFLTVPIQSFYQEMERYTANQQAVFGDSDIHYYTLVSLYKSPNNASFHTYGVDNAMYLVGFQSPFSFDGRLSIEQTIETSVHETLHMYITPGITSLKEEIDVFTAGWAPEDYTSPMYQNMPWERILDETIVRAVQGRIYSLVFQDEQKAYAQVIQKETAAGIQGLPVLLETLKAYEENPSQYPDINAFLPQLLLAYQQMQ